MCPGIAHALDSLRTKPLQSVVYFGRTPCHNRLPFRIVDASGIAVRIFRLYRRGPDTPIVVIVSAFRTAGGMSRVGVWSIAISSTNRLRTSTAMKRTTASLTLGDATPQHWPPQHGPTPEPIRTAALRHLADHRAAILKQCCHIPDAGTAPAPTGAYASRFTS